MTMRVRLAQTLLFVTALLLQIPPARAAALPVAEINHVLGEKGESLPNGVVRYSWLRTDLKVVIEHTAVHPALALQSRVTFMPAHDGSALVTGELVATQEEARRVIDVLDSSPLTITALCDHLCRESPRLTFVHFVGEGKALTLATTLREVLKATATPLRPAPAAIPAMPAKWVDEMREELGYSGRYQNGVLSIVVPRSEQVRMSGEVMPASMGVATRLNFQEAGHGRLAGTGEFALVAGEVSRVLYTLSNNHIEVTALSGHLLKESPRLFFLHFWAVGTPFDLARALRAALDRTDTGKEQ